MTWAKLLAYIDGGAGGEAVVRYQPRIHFSWGRRSPVPGLAFPGGITGARHGRNDMPKCPRIGDRSPMSIRTAAQNRIDVPTLRRGSQSTARQPLVDLLIQDLIISFHSNVPKTNLPA